MHYFLLHILESCVAHHRALFSSTALALGRKEATAPASALQRAETTWVPKLDLGTSGRTCLPALGGHLLESLSRSRNIHPWVAQSLVVGLWSWAIGGTG